MAASIILVIASSGTGSDVKRRIARWLRMASNTEMSVMMSLLWFYTLLLDTLGRMRYPRRPFSSAIIPAMVATVSSRRPLWLTTT